MFPERMKMTLKKPTHKENFTLLSKLDNAHSLGM